MADVSGSVGQGMSGSSCAGAHSMHSSGSQWRLSEHVRAARRSAAQKCQYRVFCRRTAPWRPTHAHQPSWRRVGRQQTTSRRRRRRAVLDVLVLRPRRLRGTRGCKLSQVVSASGMQPGKLTAIVYGVSKGSGPIAITADTCAQAAAWLVISRPRAPSAHVEALSELQLCFWLELSDAQATVGKRSTSALRWRRQREPPEASEPSTIGCDHLRPSFPTRPSNPWH
jgi:hypothetical protein